MMAQMINPQTTAPTIHAAIQDPCQRVRMTCPCLVTGAGMPSLVKALSGVHPVVAMASRASRAARGARRLGRVLAGRAAADRPERPWSCASRLGGALGTELTGCLPCG